VVNLVALCMVQSFGQMFEEVQNFFFLEISWWAQLLASQNDVSQIDHS
jgi:hypothetical protein